DQGLLPSTSAIRQTKFPDTEGRIHVTERLEGDGSAVRWIRIFSEKSDKPQGHFSILEVDLSGLDARIYQDAHSQYGVVIDRIHRIPPQRIRVVEESIYTLETANQDSPGHDRK